MVLADAAALAVGWGAAAGLKEPACRQRRLWRARLLAGLARWASGPTLTARWQRGCWAGGCRRRRAAVRRSASASGTLPAPGPAQPVQGCCQSHKQWDTPRQSHTNVLGQGCAASYACPGMARPGCQHVHEDHEQPGCWPTGGPGTLDRPGCQRSVARKREARPVRQGGPHPLLRRDRHGALPGGHARGLGRAQAAPVQRRQRSAERARAHRGADRERFDLRPRQPFLLSYMCCYCAPADPGSVAYGLRRGRCEM